MPTASRCETICMTWMSAIRDDSEVLVAVLKGAGDRAFCAGADLTEFGSAPSPVIARQVRWERDVWGLMCGYASASRCRHPRLLPGIRAGDELLLRPPCCLG